MKEWLFLIGAIVLETFATTMLKYSEQFTKLLPTIGMLAGYLLSFYCLSHALRTLLIGIICYLPLNPLSSKISDKMP